MKRRQFVQSVGAGSAVAGLGLASGCASTAGGGGAKVVVIGGGYAGATAAKYVRLFSEGSIQVTLVEPNAQFISCPISNLVLGGHKTMADITTPYDNLEKRHGVKLVRDMVASIDTDKRTVKLASGGELPYDRLIVSPGVDFMYETLPGMAKPGAKEAVLHAWKAGPQTVALRKQLEAMPDGGVYALSIPLAPFRCPPGPYERACMIASYFKTAKPKSKVVIFDANDDIQSKKGLFMKAWEEHYNGMIEYRPKHQVVDVDAATKTMKFEFNDDFKADVLNVIPNMRAGDIALKSGLATANNRWCEVDFLSFESKAAKNVHVLGDSIQGAPGHAQVGPHGQPARQNLCGGRGVAAARQGSARHAHLRQHLLQLRRRRRGRACGQRAPLRRREEDHAERAGSGGISTAASELESRYALAWARNIWADTLA